MKTKFFTFMTGIDQRAQKNAEAICFEADLKKLLSVVPELESSSALNSLWLSDVIEHIVICIYTNTAGDEKRRLAGLSTRPKDQNAIKAILKDIANSIDIKLDRILIDERG